MDVIIPRVAGYEYEYDFSIKEELLPALSNRKLLYPDRPNIFFEIRTSFIVKTINGEDDEIIDSEVLHSVIDDNRTTSYCKKGMINASTNFRLEDYWMTYDEIHRFEYDALVFARRAADAVDPPRRLVPVFVDFKVRTVQQNREAVSVAMERALRAENMVPFFEFPFPNWIREDLKLESLVDFLSLVEKTRVGDIEHGLAMMRVCDICSRGPFIGCQVSKVHRCGHALHSHCYTRWLLNGNRDCPSCGSVAYHDAWYDDDYED